MGGAQNSIYKLTNQQQNPVFQLVNHTEEEKAKIKTSENKPKASYARFVDRKPMIFPKVQELIDKHGGQSDSVESGEVLPVCELLPMPGCFYEGEWSQGQPHGRGKIYTKNGIYFEGGFRQGLAECEKGLLAFPDGSYYKGQFEENEINGKGIFIYAYNGTQYQGEWKSNMPHGLGEEKYEDRSSYKGKFVQGKKEDENGEFTWPNGKVYKGPFKNGKMEGSGRIFTKSGKDEFVGKFHNGLRSEGKLTTKAGNYDGRFLNGELHDLKARFVWLDNKKEYEGGFQFGELHGEGTLICHDGGVKIVGQWRRGENVKIYSMTPA